MCIADFVCIVWYPNYHPCHGERQLPVVVHLCCSWISQPYFSIPYSSLQVLKISCLSRFNKERQISHEICRLYNYPWYYRFFFTVPLFLSWAKRLTCSAEYLLCPVSNIISGIRIPLFWQFRRVWQEQPISFAASPVFKYFFSSIKSTSFLLKSALSVCVPYLFQRHTAENTTPASWLCQLFPIYHSPDLNSIPAKPLMSGWHNPAIILLHLFPCTHIKHLMQNIKIPCIRKIHVRIVCELPVPIMRTPAVLTVLTICGKS